MSDSISISRAEAKASPFHPLVRPCDLGGLDALCSDTLALFCFRDVRPIKGVAGYIDWRIFGALSRTLQHGLFLGDLHETLLLPVGGRLGPRRLFVFGLGPALRCSEPAQAQAIERAAIVMRQAGAISFSLAAACTDDEGSAENDFVRAALSLQVPELVEILVERRA